MQYIGVKMFINNFFLENYIQISTLTIVIKVEKTLKGSLDSIPSPSLSVKIQITKRPAMFCLCQQTFPFMICIFTEGEGDGIESRLPFKVFSALIISIKFFT